MAKFAEFISHQWLSKNSTRQRKQNNTTLKNQTQQQIPFLLLLLLQIPYPFSNFPKKIPKSNKPTKTSKKK
jgi:hypothetical protein